MGVIPACTAEGHSERSEESSASTNQARPHNHLPTCPPAPDTYPFPTPTPSPYPVSMNAAPKLPPVHPLTRHSRVSSLTRHSRPDREPRGREKGCTLPLDDNRCLHDETRICFPYFLKNNSFLCLSTLHNVKTIRPKTAHTGTNRHSPDRVPLNHPYDSCTISPLAMVVSVATSMIASYPTSVAGGRISPLPTMSEIALRYRLTAAPPATYNLSVQPARGCLLASFAESCIGTAANDDDSLHESCGVIGVYAPGFNVAQTAFYGLYALQHRGQESAGISTAPVKASIPTLPWGSCPRPSERAIWIAWKGILP